MLTELRKKAQITIPKAVVDKLGLREGDKLEIVESDGIIYLMPVAVYPKKYIDDLKAEISTVKGKLQSGEQLVFESVEDLFTQLDESER
jgi:AbrB family looped-hinge helix DNA binding protein